MSAPPSTADAAIPLRGVIRNYTWGSPTDIPRLLGVPPTDEPAAELWFGAHPDDPAPAPDHGTTLDQLITHDPTALLGTYVVDRFGPRLPFLLKVLAARTALSMQVHPSLAQARSGYAAEENRHVPPSSPQRSYHDANHKPELLCALSEFDALCGFRPVADTLRLLDALSVEGLRDYRALLAGPDGLRAAFTALLSSDEAKLVDSVVAACRAYSGREWATATRAVLLAADDFPGDIGCVLALLLNAVHLAPGHAVYLGAGQVHAYLRGMGVEIMANSDNVVRCGLTTKHVDRPEVLAITSFVELPNPVRLPIESRPGEWRFDTPAPDFSLSVLDVAGEMVLEPHPGPRILLCTEGGVTVGGRSRAVVLRAGQAAFLVAGWSGTVSGRGRVFVAGVSRLTALDPAAESVG